MDTKIIYTPDQIKDLENMGAALATVPENKRVSAINEAAAYIRGFASGVQSVLTVQPTA